ncbi:interferon-inducible GTPase 5-like [Paramuricea clavata]|uniref:Interferon-inducible GTPase 5-like n=1 Tax=Paramuricea clavata TaxID=317549 RepID=A0A7D9I9F2_PARCT|nr:interferon-inducible GTPase 5-like [Paramuricea clavata]
MGKAQSKDEEYSEEFQEAKRQIEEKGVAGAQAMMRETLIGWKDIKIKIGVTGNAGVGKSSFINAIRGIDDEDEENDDDKSGARAAKTGQIETTMKPASYTYPESPNITLMDLPGIGTPTYPDLDIYCERVGLETYDTFMILTSTRCTKLELELAQKIKSMGKSFFLIRTKIDQDKKNEKRRKKPDIEAMLKRIRAYLYEIVKDFGIREDEIFLISNHKRDKWEFSRLVEAILGKLPAHQKEALTLSLKILSKDVVIGKVEILRSQLWKASLIFHLTIVVESELYFRPMLDILSALSIDHDESKTAHLARSERVVLAFLGRRTEFFRSQLGLPEEDSDEFEKMKPKFQERMRKFYPNEEDESFWARCFAIDISNITSTCRPSGRLTKVEKILNRVLDEMQQLSLDLLDEAATHTQEPRTGDAKQSET